jgi:hypothetical protein
MDSSVLCHLVMLHVCHFYYVLATLRYVFSAVQLKCASVYMSYLITTVVRNTEICEPTLQGRKWKIRGVFGLPLGCWGPGMNPGLRYNGVCTASLTIFFPVPGVLTFVLTSP